MAERGIRTFKGMLFKRIDASEKENPQWVDFIYPVTLTYNVRRVHAVTKHTPLDAEKKENTVDVYINMGLKAKHSRRYPPLEVGDRVKIYRKRKRGEKERVAVWTQDSYIIEKTEEYDSQTYYYTSQGRRPYLRHELLLIQKKD